MEEWLETPEERELRILRRKIRKAKDKIKEEIKASPFRTRVKIEPGMSPLPPLPPSPPQLVLTKPRDIPILELHQLEGLEATAHLQMFIELVEQVTDDDLTRVTVAKSRLGSEIAMLIHNQQQKVRSFTWPSLCNFLRTEFTLDVNIDRAWQDLDSTQYDWDESPQSFSNRFLCKYAVLETKFPQEKFPNRDKTIKRLIWHGLPRELKDRVEGFLEEDYPLARFLDRVEYQRQMYLQTNPSRVNKVKDPPKPKVKDPNQGQMNHQDPAPSPSQSKMERLEKQVKELTAKLGKMQTSVPQVSPQHMLLPPFPIRPPPPRPQFQLPKYCAFCRSYTHSLRECTKAPKDNSCFDCGRQQCRRGNPGCPGKVQPQKSI